MRVKMLVTYEFQDELTTVRHHKGTYVDVADHRGAEWVKQEIAVAAPVENAHLDAQDPDKGLTKEERAEKKAALAAGKPWPPLKLVKDDAMAATPSTSATSDAAASSGSPSSASSSSTSSGAASKRSTTTTEG